MIVGFIYPFHGTPLRKYCLEKHNLTLDDVDIVTLGWDYQTYYRLRSISYSFDSKKTAEEIFPKKYFRYSKTPKIAMVPHHLSHAASAYYASGFEKADPYNIDELNRMLKVADDRETEVVDGKSVAGPKARASPGSPDMQKRPTSRDQ